MQNDGSLATKPNLGSNELLSGQEAGIDLLMPLRTEPSLNGQCPSMHLCYPANQFECQGNGAALPRELPSSVVYRRGKAFENSSHAPATIRQQPRHGFKRSILSNSSWPLQQELDGCGTSASCAAAGFDAPPYDPSPGLGICTLPYHARALKERTYNVVLRGSLTTAMRAGILRKALAKWPFMENERPSIYAGPASRSTGNRITMEQYAPAVHQRCVPNPCPLQVRNLVIRLQELPRSIRVHIYVLLTGLEFLPSRATVTKESQSLKKSTKLISPRPAPDFLKMTRAQKQAYLTSPSMNRIITQVQPQAMSLDDKHELKDDPSCSNAYDVSAFQEFCNNPRPEITDITIALWSRTTLPGFFSDVSYGHGVNYTPKAGLATPIQNPLAWLPDTLSHQEEMCAIWETAFRRFPRSVKTVTVVVYKPVVLDWQDVVITMQRLKLYASRRAGASIGWEVEVQ